MDRIQRLRVNGGIRLFDRSISINPAPFWHARFQVGGGITVVL
jgi:hypothetical protein